MFIPEISGNLTVEKKDQLLQLLKEIETGLDFTLNLKPLERRTINKMGDRSKPFVDKALEIVSQNSELIPEYLDKDEFRKYYDLSQYLFSLLILMAKLTEKIEDTMFVAGAQAVDWSLKLYEYLKIASRGGVPGTDQLVAELAKRYQYRANKGGSVEKKDEPASS